MGFVTLLFSVREAFRKIDNVSTIVVAGVEVNRAISDSIAAMGGVRLASARSKSL